MNELIQGVEVLNINEFYRPTIWVVLIIIIAMIIGLVIDLNFINRNNPIITCIFLAISIVFICGVMINQTKYLSKYWCTEYECYLHEDKINFKKFNNKCEILNKDGKIYTIKLKKDNYINE